jgi:sulfur-oxidizing protein SoxZ
VSVARAIINVPASARRGEIIEIKALVAHDMETGFRRTQTGVLIPRNIITDFACTYNGAEIFRAEFYPAIAANPYVAFTTRVSESGTIACTWTGDNGYALTESVPISVT